MAPDCLRWIHYIDETKAWIDVQFASDKKAHISSLYRFALRCAFFAFCAFLLSRRIVCFNSSFAGATLSPFLLASENQIFIYSSHELNSEKNHSLHCFELWGKKSHEWSCFIGNWFLTLPLVSTLMKNVSFRTSRKMWNRTIQWTPGAKSLNN